MTTGNITSGSTTAPGHYHKKYWVGVDGKYDSIGRLRYNDYSLILEDADLTPSTMTGTSCVTPVLGYFYTWSSNDELDLLSRVTESARGHNFNLGVAMAEGGKTVEMVVNSVARIAKSIIAVKHGRIGDAARHLGVSPRGSDYKPLKTKEISAQWLELQYGWLPLLGDIHQSALAYSAIADKPRVSSFKVSLTRKHKYYSVGSGYTHNYDEVYQKRYHVFMQESLSAPRSLGLLDPLSVAWELVPFSFVADWFIPIGTYLEVQNSIPNLNAHYRVLVRRKKQGSAWYSGGVSYWDDFWMNGATTSVQSLSLTRSSQSTVSVPRPSFRSLPEAMSPTRIWNSVALLHQIVL